jgi:hypothetical protein
MNRQDARNARREEIENPSLGAPGVLAVLSPGETPSDRLVGLAFPSIRI